MKLSTDEIQRLKRLTERSDNCLEFLGYSVNLDSGEIYDKLKNVALSDKAVAVTLQTLVKHYSKAEPIEKTGRLLKFQDLPGGTAYEKAFVQRAVLPVVEAFGNELAELVKAAKPLNGIALSYGDSSVEIHALPKIPITYILWKAAEDFSATATVLFDETASNYLPTEDLGVLGEITTIRLEQSWAILKKQKA